jgi:hypothetical protein
MSPRWGILTNRQSQSDSDSASTYQVAVTYCHCKELLPWRHVYISDSLPYRMTWLQQHHLGDEFIFSYFQIRHSIKMDLAEIGLDSVDWIGMA